MNDEFYISLCRLFKSIVVDVTDINNDVLFEHTVDLSTVDLSIVVPGETPNVHPNLNRDLDTNIEVYSIMLNLENVQNVERCFKLYLIIDPDADDTNDVFILLSSKWDGFPKLDYIISDNILSQQEYNSLQTLMFLETEE